MSEPNKYEQQAIELYTGKITAFAETIRECALRLEAEDLLQDFIKAVTATVSPHDRVNCMMEFLRSPR
jgi:hypothetical protein